MSTLGTARFCSCDDAEQVKRTCWLGMESSKYFGTVSNVWHAGCGRIVRPALLKQFLGESNFRTTIKKKVLVHNQQKLT